MTWDAFHRRGEVLRAVVDEADKHRDGVLPMDLPGVAETFGDELALVGALQLRWHTRLAGTIEHELGGAPRALAPAVVAAWRRTATEMPGVRAILDTCAAAPSSEEMARALAKARRKDWALMAAMAGKAGAHDDRAAAVGRALEAQARAGYQPVTVDRATAISRGRHRSRDDRESLLGRIRAHLAA